MAEFVEFDFPLPDDERIHHIWNQISTLRHEVYADELKQYEANTTGRLDDPGRHFIACMEGDSIAGYISLNPPNSKPFRLTKYFSEEVLAQTVYPSCENGMEACFEVRGLTVSPQHRGKNLAFRLMRYALEFVHNRGGTDIVAMGHQQVVDLYRNNGMHVFSEVESLHGETTYHPMHMNVEATFREFAAKISRDKADESSDDACYHGGQSWDTSGFDFEVRDNLVVADVLDSPFPPCPEVLEILHEQLERCCHESPPTQCDELIETIAEVRSVSSHHVVVSSGSSSLMFSLLPRLLDENSRVLLLSPMYGEYSHILEHVIGCHMTYFVLQDAEGFNIAHEDLVVQAKEHDAVILVNPNSPTGVHCERMESIVKSIAASCDSSSACKMIWVDETYINYLPEAKSLEFLTASVPELIVCKSMSKCYALSGLRVAYAVSQQMLTLRKYIPPWSVSLPGQLAAVLALRNEAYYEEQYQIIHRQRQAFHQDLDLLGFRVFPSVANYLLTYLPEDSGHNSASFVEACKEAGVFVRDAQNMGVSLPNTAVRFAIRSAEENQRVLETVRAVLGR